MGVPLAVGPSRVVLQMPFIDTFQCLGNPSKLCVLETTERVYSFDPEDGKLQPLYELRAPGVFGWMASPDGEQLALVYAGSKHKITFVTLRNNGRREESFGMGMDWMPDSKGLLVTGEEVLHEREEFDKDEARFLEMLARGRSREFPNPRRAGHPDSYQ